MVRENRYLSGPQSADISNPDDLSLAGTPLVMEGDMRAFAGVDVPRSDAVSGDSSRS